MLPNACLILNIATVQHSHVTKEGIFLSAATAREAPIIWRAETTITTGIGDPPDPEQIPESYDHVPEPWVARKKRCPQEITAAGVGSI
jgi:hypothetical protein